MKSSLLRLSVDATRPATSTWAPLPNRTPLGLRMKTCPLAVSDPKISVGFCPSTRLRAMLEAEGCAKRTDSSELIPKVCQLMAARSVPWVISVLVPERLTLACPATTCSPVGPAHAGPTPARSANATALATGRIDGRKAEAKVVVRRPALTRAAPALRDNCEELLTLPCSG